MSTNRITAAAVSAVLLVGGATTAILYPTPATANSGYLQADALSANITLSRGAVSLENARLLNGSLNTRNASALNDLAAAPAPAVAATVAPAAPAAPATSAATPAPAPKPAPAATTAQATPTQKATPTPKATPSETPTDDSESASPTPSPTKTATKSSTTSTATASPTSDASSTSTSSSSGLDLRRASMWDQIAVCESTSDWSINTGNGYYGGLQFSLSTWKMYGGTSFASRPDLASRGEQITIANKVYDTEGGASADWACARILGIS